MDCKEENKGTCNIATNTCECNEGYVASGPICVGWFNFLLFFLIEAI